MEKDTDGALWKDCDISPYRITHDEFKELDIEEIVVSYDPAVTDSEKQEKINQRILVTIPMKMVLSLELDVKIIIITF